MNKAETFFYNNAGYSYDPKTESAEQGRQKCAVSLATAEAWASVNDIGFEWGPDMDAPGEWVCVAMERTDTGMRCIGSLSGVDLRPDSHPCNDPYARVVEAELALNAMCERTAHA